MMAGMFSVGYYLSNLLSFAYIMGTVLTCSLLECLIA